MKRCLIVVDYQEDFVSGSLGFPKAVALEENIAEKIGEYRKNGDAVVFTFDTHGENYMDTQEGRYLPIPHCLRGTKGHGLYGKVAELMLESDERFYKDAFGSGELYAFLKGQAFESIELVGVVSNICVLSNAVLAKTAQPETPVLVDAACVSSNDERLNEQALDVMQGLQIRVINRE